MQVQQQIINELVWIERVLQQPTNSVLHFNQLSRIVIIAVFQHLRLACHAHFLLIKELAILFWRD